MLILIEFRPVGERVILNVTEQDKANIVDASIDPNRNYRYYLVDNLLTGTKRNIAVKYIYPIITGQEKKVEDSWCTIILLE